MKASLVWIGCLSALLAGCLGEDCGFQVLSESKSPDSKYIAAIVASNCGATTPFARHVMLRESTEGFDGENRNNTIFTERGTRSIDVRWLDSTHVVIRRIPNQDDIFKELESWKGITISYVADWPDGTTKPSL